jgi:hypothetical protein
LQSKIVKAICYVIESIKGKNIKRLTKE